MRLTPAKITKGKTLGFLFFFSVEAIGLPQVLKRDPTAASGRCLIAAVSTEAQAESLLQQYKISTVKSKPKEKIALAQGVAQAQALLGKRVAFVKNVEFSFAARKGYSRYEGYRAGKHHIQMNRCDSKGKKCAQNNNVAHLMHELGHKVGHSTFARGETFYEAYSRLAGKCRPTAYSMSSRNEEFAEVFAAFLTHPELLSDGDPACKRAYEFFARDVFIENGELASCEPRARKTLLARAGNMGGADVMVADGRDAPKASERILGDSRPRTPPVERRIAQAPIWDDDVVPSSKAAARVRREQAQASNPWVFGDEAPDANADGEREAERDLEREREFADWLWGK